MSNEKKYSGGCFCGKVRYYTIGDPVRTRACHCRYCQLRAETFFDLLKIFASTLNQKAKMNQD